MPVDSALYAFFEVLKVLMFPGLELVLIISECIKVSLLCIASQVEVIFWY